MVRNSSEGSLIKVLERVQSDLKLIHLYCSDMELKEKLNKLMEYIELETVGDKATLIELSLFKAKETKGRYPDLNTNFYLLYRRLVEGQISLQEAQTLYDMYNKEYKIKSKGLG